MMKNKSNFVKGITMFMGISSIAGIAVLGLTYIIMLILK